jgi:hypothetical protein
MLTGGHYMTGIKCVCVCVCVGAEQDMQGDAAAGSGADLQGLQRGDDRGTAACQR